MRTAEAGEERRPLGPREGFEIFPAGLGCAAELREAALALPPSPAREAIGAFLERREALAPAAAQWLPLSTSSPPNRPSR